MLTLVTAATAQPLDWDAEVKGHLRLDSEDERARVENLLVPAAAQWAEQFTNRALITQTWKLVVPRWPRGGGPIELPKPPLSSVTHVKYYDGDGVLQTWASSNYYVEAPAGPSAVPARIFPSYNVSYPAYRAQQNAIEVQFVCGYGATWESVPSQLRAAMLLIVGEMFERREEAIVGTISSSSLSARRLAWPYRVRLFPDVETARLRQSPPTSTLADWWLTP